MRRVRALLLEHAITVLLVASPAAAGKPVTERVADDDVGILDEFLTDACRFDVFVDASGHITFRLWTDAEGNPIRELNNFGVRLRFYSEDGSVRTVDVGADRVTHKPDGSFTNVVIGNVQSIQIPGQGRLYADGGTTTCCSPSRIPPATRFSRSCAGRVSTQVTRWR